MPDIPEFKINLTWLIRQGKIKIGLNIWKTLKKYFFNQKP